MNFIDQPTETALKFWRFGGNQSERLCATLLHSEGFKRVDPQCPLGGPDGKKDVLFELNGWRYVAACYFPTTEKDFKNIQDKFEDDFKGVNRNSARGIAFFTNQHLTPGEREILEKIATNASASAIIYHVEAIRAILDSPRGYGMRLEFLRIPMKPEEQASFISQFGSDLSAAMDRSSGVIASMSKKINEIHATIVGNDDQSFTSAPLRLAATIATRAMVSGLASASDKTNIQATTTFITENLNLELLRYLHRSMLDEESDRHQAGELRSVGVWIGAPGSMPEHARYIPPDPKEVPALVNVLLKNWRENYPDILKTTKSKKIDQIVQFHYSFLRIHPFLDGNGRLARLLMEQQAKELLNIDRRIILEDSVAYLEALQLAHLDMEPLRRIITQALLGSWNVEG